jgi:hypothetical protein
VLAWLYRHDGLDAVTGPEAGLARPLDDGEVGLRESEQSAEFCVDAVRVGLGLAPRLGCGPARDLKACWVVRRDAPAWPVDTRGELVGWQR